MPIEQQSHERSEGINRRLEEAENDEMAGNFVSGDLIRNSIDQP